jgi:hypothetical protein
MGRGWKRTEAHPRHRASPSPDRTPHSIRWISYWNLGHVFRHNQNALSAILLLWTLAFNLLQLFIYRRLGRCRRPKDPTDTIRHIVEVMLREMATLPAPIPWATLLLNTS